MMLLYTSPEYVTTLSVHLFSDNNNFLVSNVPFFCSVDLFSYPHYKLLICLLGGHNMEYSILQ